MSKKYIFESKTISSLPEGSKFYVNSGGNIRQIAEGDLGYLKKDDVADLTDLWSFSNDIVFPLSNQGLVIKNGVITDYTGSSSVVIIPESIDGEEITGIGDNAFKDTSVTTIFIPSTVNTISSSAFLGLEDIDIYINKKKNSISGQYWGAASGQIIWTDEWIGFMMVVVEKSSLG